MNLSRSTCLVIAWSFPVGCVAGVEMDWQLVSPRVSAAQAGGADFMMIERMVGCMWFGNSRKLDPFPPFSRDIATRFSSV